MPPPTDTSSPASHRPLDRVLSPSASPATSRRFDDRDRASIISTSTKGWAPLNTSKRGSVMGSPQLATTVTASEGPRRTSSSFKHVRGNNLVSNSIFKSSPTITASPPLGRPVGGAGRKSSGGKTRKVSGSTVVPGRKVSGGSRNIVRAGSTPRKASLTEDLRTSNGVPSSSSASTAEGSPSAKKRVGNLAEEGYVSRSPFLQRMDSDRPVASREERSVPAVIRSERTSMSTQPIESPGLSAASIAHVMHHQSPAASSPTKSSLTSRRLRGPRLSDPSSTSQIYGSSTYSSSSLSRGMGQGKTVTFRDVADVKEFETESSGAEEWEDEQMEEEESDSWDEVLLGPGHPSQERRFEESFDEATPSPEMDLSGLRRYGSLNSGTRGGRSPLQRERGAAYAEEEREEEGYAGYVAGLEHQSHHQEDEDQSMTANFIDSLVEDGYLSPPRSQSDPALAGYVHPGISHGEQVGVSIGESMERIGSARTEYGVVDEGGVPFGRTHHADRQAAAREVQRAHHEPAVQQPALPRQGDESMLRNADVRTPATTQANYDQNGITAHQDGQFVDPFVTIQTATRINAGLAQEAQRQEGGIPLGRTSHAERAKVARVMATRGLGLGMPARPMVPFVQGAPQAHSEDGSDDDEDDRGYSIPDLARIVKSDTDHGWSAQQSTYEDRHLGTREAVSLAPIVSPLPQESGASQMEGSMNGKRALPKPPQPTPVTGMPSPVEKEERPREVPEPVTSPVSLVAGPFLRTHSLQTKMFGLSLPFSLPALSSGTSPLFATGFKAESESGSEDSGEHDLYDQDEPDAPEQERALTPPPARVFDRQQPASPHRIPEFDFESPSTRRNRGQASDDGDPMDEAFKLVEAALPKLSIGTGSGDKTDVKSRLSGLFGERKDALQQSSASSSSDSLDDHDSKASASARIRPRISKDVIRARLEEKRSLTNLGSARPVPVDDDVFLSPPRSAQAKGLAPLDTFLTAASPIRPGLRARQDTMSAEEVLQNVPEPKSALEQLVSNFTFTEFDEFAQSPASPIKDHESFTLQQAAGGRVVRHATSENVLGNKVRSSQRLALSPSGLEGIEEATTPDTTINEGDDVTLGQGLNAGGPPKRRRSMSTGDARPRGVATTDSITNRMSLLDTFKFEDSTSILTAFEKELSDRNVAKPYTIREHKTVYASADDKVKHNIAGDVDKGRAWRQVRKVSDINQYAKEIKAMKAKASNSSKSFGTIFVKVLGIEALNLPLPKEDTSFCITLDNGIDYIRTPYSTLKEGVKINQEFALIEHANFEFALGVEIRRDAHINKLIQANANPAPRPTAGSRGSVMNETASIQSSTRGLKSLFSSPRKMSKAPKSLMPEPPRESAVQEDNIARYFTDGDSTVGRTHIAFKPIAKNCDARLLEIRYPMFGMYQAPVAASASVPVVTTQRGTRHSVQTLPTPQPAAAPVRKQVCKITLQVFRLPPLPGLTDAQLPQSIDECLRGMRHHAWHEHEYHQGVMTQNGGDCVAPRRRPFRLIGGNLVASNAVTKKTISTIDLRKATALVDENSDAAVAGKKKSLEEELEAGYTKMPRSFTLRFEDGDFITFWTDTDEDKASWMKALGALIGKVPSNPLWAELLAARQRQLKARSGSRMSLAAVVATEPTKGEAPPAVPAK